MQGQETTKELILKTLCICYEKSWANEAFFELLHFFDIETYEEKGQKEGVIIDGARIGFSSLGLANRDAAQSVNPKMLTNEEIALLDKYSKQITANEERELRASDAPNLFQAYSDPEIEKTDAREDELNALREKEGIEEERGLDK